MSINNVYFPTWEPDFNTQLLNIPSYITHVTLSFLRPNANFVDFNNKMDTVFYNGDITLLELKELITKCRNNGSQKRVILASTGGEIAGNFLNVNFEGLADVICELGLDGIDIDYEPNGIMTETIEEIDKYKELIMGLRKNLDLKSKADGKRYLISCAPTGIGLFDSNKFKDLEKEYCHVINNLKGLIPVEEQKDELSVGSLEDMNTLKLSKLKVGTVGSSFNFDSAGKMLSVFKALNNNTTMNEYKYIGQMIDIVFYQAYNIGSGNVLAKILCYEKHRELSDFFENIKTGSGFVIGHGSHVGKEAWPHFSYTKKRLGYIYSYIHNYGRKSDGASFWSYFSSCFDDSVNVPYYGMGYKTTGEIFNHVSQLLGIVK